MRFANRTNLPPNPIVGLSDKIAEISKVSKDFIPMQQGDMLFPTPALIKKSASEALEKGYTRYAPSLGFLELKQAIAEKLHTKNSVECDPEREILVTQGSTEALYVAVQALLEPGDEAILLDPCYPPYDSLIRSSGASPVHIRSDEDAGWRSPIDLIQEHISPRTKVILVNTPNNPTGEVYPRDYLEALGEVALRNNVVILSDEAYEALLYDGSRHVSMASFESLKSQCVSAYSFSKTYAMTGWRLGYLCGPSEFIARASVIHNLVLAHVSSPIQIAGVSAIKDAENSTIEFVSSLDKRRRILVEELNRIPKTNCRLPKGTFYAFPNFTETGIPSSELADRFLAEKVGASPGAFFGQCAEGYMRLSFSTVDEEQIVEAAKRIKRALTN